MHSTGSKGTTLLRRVSKIAKSDHELRHVCPFARPSVRPSVCPSVRPSVCPSVRPSVRPSVCPSVCPSVRPSVCPSFRLSVRLSLPSVLPSTWNNSVPTGRIFIKFDIWMFSENLSRKVELRWSLTRKTDTSHDDLCTFITLSRSFLLRTRNISDESRIENQSRNFICNNFLSILSFMRWWGKFCSVGQTTD